ncbi:dienelactone hydrolase family protein [Xanthobacter dioxanivorans]|uniref:Dienelactone hydrolase family protein n=1 Tax=Xanthobacter dioxanivorans TaxID=2528964 RepID=A0A974SJG8_9HYPH|nr:dienelactone hydrolase family protein [Xanthobacter dioxanivorans]QRG07239.1 dienelactone hydrolase family protein [Xanthobacter dioxanivorans]
MKTEELCYEADGLSMIGHLAWDETATTPRPAVLVFPEAFGLGAHAKARAERIVSEFGYVALACDLHGDQKVFPDLGTMMPVLTALRGDIARVRARTRKALEALLRRREVDASRVAAIGFCYGGTLAYELALAGADIKAAVGFHSGLQVSAPQDAGQIKAKVLALIGADDPGVPPEDRAAFEAVLRAGKVDWQMTLYGGVVHSFTNPDADLLGKPDFLRYDAVADRRSWQQMRALFAEVLGESPTS